MKMKNNSVTPYNITLTILAITMILILSFVVFIPNQKVYAEYSDLNNNSLVNFNQIAKPQLYSNDFYNFGGTDSNGYFSISLKNKSVTWARMNIADSFDTAHKYYFVFNSDLGNGMNLYAKDGTVTLLTNFVGSTILSGYNNYQFNMSSYFDSNPNGSIKVQMMCIDLTYMFGVGNEPNLQQAKEYFISYYPYNAGTQIPFSKSYLQGYQDGAQSVYENLSITLNSYTIGANSQTYANNTIERGELYLDQQYSTYAFNGVIAINLLGQVERGTNINIDFELIIPSLQGEPSNTWESFTLYFAYVDSNNNLVNITGINAKYIGSLKNAYKGDFALPITTYTIYCYLQYNTVGGNLAPLTALASKSDITFKGLDIAQIVNNAYNKGASDTNLKYSPGGVLYQSIYDLGKSEGIAQGNTFVSGLDVISTTFTKVFSIFNAEILPGIPLSVFILLPLLFGLIMFVVKIAKGG